jgi:enamine deaminase RidA (YjgF/YER057c/UK114 family)
MASALDALEKRLHENGLARENVMSILVFIAAMDGKAEMNRAWEAWVPRDHAPIRACIAAGLDGDDRVELIVTAGR